MARIASSIQVSKPVEDVFAYLNKAESHARFIPNMAEFRQTSPGAFGRIGATARGILNYMGVKIEVLYEIVEHETNRRLTMKGQMGPVIFTDGYILDQIGNGTQINFWLELNLTGWAKILSPFAGLIGKIHAWETLKNLRQELGKVEGIASSSHSSFKARGS